MTSKNHLSRRFSDSNKWRFIVDFGGYWSGLIEKWINGL